eukprot:CFRG7191T1
MLATSMVAAKMAAPIVGETDTWINRAWTNSDASPESVSDDHYVILIDPYDESESQIEEWHAEGHYILCYNNVGSWEDWREDEDTFPTDLLGKKMSGWDGETWWDVTQWDNDRLQTAHTTRMKWMKEKGCDGLEMDNIDCAANNCVSGYSTDDLREDNENYVKWLAQEAVSQGMDPSMKNGIEMFSSLSEYFVMAVNEQCEEYDECDTYTEYFADKGKPVFAVEYTSSRSAAGCDWANDNNFSRKYWTSSGQYRDCRD